MKKYSVIGLFALLCVSLSAEDEVCKHSLKCSMEHIYEETPISVDSIGEMFSQGIFYGRMRLNSFGFKWRKELNISGINVRKNHVIAAIGGSLVYKSAYLNGFGFTAGLYTSQARGTLDSDEIYLYKAGKDTFSRYDFLTEGKKGITTLAEGYLEYRYDDTSLKLGHQIFESFLTKSNDTKMIPNTFEGITLQSQNFLESKWKVAYLTKQKLRDHSTFHHVLAYGDNGVKPYDIFSHNDDSAMHRGLTLAQLKAKGIEDKLVILEGLNQSVENVTLQGNYTTVPKLLSYAMLQASYHLDLGEWSVLPAVRMLYQFDKGAGEIGGANYLNIATGYANPNSLESSLLAARIDVVNEAFKFRFAYSEVADKGDIIAPWRGFPTGGFTRAMGQYNWYANTKSYMAQLDYEFESVPDLKVISRFVIQDFDDEKEGVQADSTVFTLDISKKLLDNKLYLKTRYAYVVGDDNTVLSNGFKKLDPSYNELRLEVNYLF